METTWPPSFIGSEVTDVPKVGSPGLSCILGLPLAGAILQVQLAKCWKPRVSGGTHLCRTHLIGLGHE